MTKYEVIPAIDLKVGDVIKVWWMPSGAVLLAIKPYTGRFVEWLAVGEFQSVGKSGSTAMSIGKYDWFERRVYDALLPKPIMSMRELVGQEA